MIHDGITCRKSKVFSWRSGDPEMDVDIHGKPVHQRYFAIVRLSQCPVEVEHGETYRNTRGVAQAFPVAFGGTNYAYGKPQIIRNSKKWLFVRVSGGERVWECSYVKTPVYVIQGFGKVFVGALYRALKDVER